MNLNNLLLLKFRNNPGFTHTYSRIILEKLIKNIQDLKQKKSQKSPSSIHPQNQDFENYCHDETQLQNFQKLLNKTPLTQKKTVSNNLENEECVKEDHVARSLLNEQENFQEKTRCKNCCEIEKKLLKSEQKNVNLMFENKKLKDALNNAANIQQNLMQSWSAINPNQINEENQNINGVSLQNPANESEELLNRIENLMVELTRMMDNLENINNNNVTNNNFTYQLTNSTNNFNNNTYHLLNSANNINLNSILNNQSNNLSNIVPNINNNLINKANLSSAMNLGGSQTKNQNASVGYYGGNQQFSHLDNTNLNKSAGFKQA